jgi:hypothetical protein
MASWVSLFDSTPTLCGFGGAYGKLTAVPRECATHLKSACFEVYVLPAQGQQLALPQAGLDGHDVEGF